MTPRAALPTSPLAGDANGWRCNCLWWSNAGNPATPLSDFMVLAIMMT